MDQVASGSEQRSQWVPKTCVKNHPKVVKLQLKQMCSDNNNIFVRDSRYESRDARNDELSQLTI